MYQVLVNLANNMLCKQYENRLAKYDIFLYKFWPPRREDGRFELVTFDSRGAVSSRLRIQQIAITYYYSDTFVHIILATLTLCSSQEVCNLRLEASCLGNRFPERSISHLNPDAAKSDAIKTSALLEDLNSLPFGVATLGLFDLYEPALSSILTGLQDLVAHLEAVAETCQTKGLSTRHQQNNLNEVVILIKDCKRLVYLKFAIMTC